MYFASSTISIHILRGVLGLAALYCSILTLATIPWLALLLLAAAVYLLRGCPICWTLGLIETIAMTVHKHNEGNIAETAAAPPMQTDSAPA